VTTIVGSTDAGKSAIIRALRWLFLNQPRGKKYIRHGASNCSVSVSIDGRIIKRSKGKRNYYQLDDQIFKAFGNNVPSPIEDVLKVTELNFQKQHDASFWLSLTPTEVGKQLNSIVNMELMDKVLRRIQNDERKLKSQIEYEDERRTEYKKHLQDLRPVKDVSAAFESLLSIRFVLDGLTTQQTRLRVLIDSLSSLSSTLEINGAVYAGLRGLIQQQTAIEHTKNYADRLSELLDELESLSGLPDDNVMEVLNEVLSLQPDHKPIERLEECLDSISQYEQELEECRNQLQAINTTISKVSKAIRVCPTCGKTLSDEQ